jgi:hypothetical protein
MVGEDHERPGWRPPPRGRGMAIIGIVGGGLEASEPELAGA